MAKSNLKIIPIKPNEIADYKAKPIPKGEVDPDIYEMYKGIRW